MRKITILTVITANILNYTKSKFNYLYSTCIMVGEPMRIKFFPLQSFVKPKIQLVVLNLYYG